VGSGDDNDGRLIAVALMIVGIGFLGIMTATMTSFFLDPEKGAEERHSIEERLVRIEEKLDALIEQRDR
jgi:voltage-gated potassium channel